MKYKNIPQTELNVSAICLGLSLIGSDLSEQKSFNLLDAFHEKGGNFLDTAHNYADWIKGAKGKCLSEKTLGRWIKKRGNRRKIIVGTKGGCYDLSTYTPNSSSSESIVGQLNQSLENLQTDYIDLYWLHRDDPSRPVAHFVDMLNEQMRLGKIKYFGCSNWTVQRIKQVMDYAGKHNLQGFVANQMWWSLAAPTLKDFPDKTIVAMDAETIEFHKTTGLAAIPYSSQARGFFSKLSKLGEAGLDEGLKKLYYSEKNILIFERLKKIVSVLQKSVTEVSLAYLTSHPFVTIPIIGPKSVEQLKESLKASEVVLSEEMLLYLKP
ncbi:MAG: aldo/keto reductase [Candidatus Omnitrophota bacterium]